MTKSYSAMTERDSVEAGVQTGSADLEGFDEAEYLRLYPDVRAAVDRGDVESGYEHYMLYGASESRGFPRAKSWDERKKYFDEEFYRRRYEFDGDAFSHYCNSGWRTGWMPNALFSPVLYSAQVPSVSGDPLLHYVENWRTSPFVSPVFDAQGYLECYGDVVQSDVEPFLHFLTHGVGEGRAPGFALFDIPRRRVEYPEFDWAAAGEKLGVPLERIDHDVADAYQALVDGAYCRKQYGYPGHLRSDAYCYAVYGRQNGLSPNAFFDVKWYAARHDISSQDPIWHHLLTGSRPTPFFCGKSYLRANSDVAELHSELTALVHFVAHGAGEKRSLGLSAEQLSAVRKIEPDYDWEVAAKHYEFPAGGEANESAPQTDGTKPPVLSAASAVVDRSQVSRMLLKAKGKKVVSFDVWDTVLRRGCDPDEIKFYAAGVLLSCLKRSVISVHLTPIEAFRLRQWAELRTADAQYEYRHDAMLREWLALCGVRAQAEIDCLIQKVAAAEIAREIAMTRVDPTAMAMLEALPRTRKIAISDFYLSSKVLRQILQHHGIDKHFAEIYVSCDFMRTKRDGSLFGEVLQCEGVSTKELLHIGDNAKADRDIPMSLGIDAILYEDLIELDRKQYFRAHLDALLAGGGDIASDAFRRSVATDAPEATSDQPHSSVDLLAEIFTGFGLSILEKAHQLGVDKVFFATREGLFFRKVYDLLARHDVLGIGHYPQSAIVEVSRRATFAASLRNGSLKEMMRLWSMYSVQSMSAFAKSLNLDADRLREFCTKYHLPFDEPIQYPWTDARVQVLFKDPSVQSWLASESTSQRDELWDYLEKAGFEPAANRSRLFVDIGWRGSIQDNLAFLVNGQIEGMYLALHRYVAEQPANATKHGFLADHNKDQFEFHFGDFAPLEFITNGCGGSVVGYERGKSLRDISASEEIFLREEILPIQKSILARIESWAPNLRDSPLTWANGWRHAARRAVLRYMENPDPYIAEVFLRLEHNETFGAGEIQTIAGDLDDTRPDALGGAALHSAVSTKLREHRWAQAWRQSREGQSYLDLPLAGKLMLPRIEGVVRAPAVVRSLGYQISIFAPEPVRGSGGHRTIYNLARALDGAGFTVHLFSERRGNDYDYKEMELHGSSVKLHDAWHAGVIPDGAFATIQHSATYLSEFFDDRVKKFYFVQDYEAEFNPVSDNYVRGQNSFAANLNHICIGRWLTHRLRAEYACGAASAGLGVDTDIYRPLVDSVRRDRIAVLFQPEKWRRLPDHCLEALAIVKGRRPQTEIVFYGSHTAPNAPFRHTHLGLVNDLEELNRLYNSAAIGLCISMTNPSRIPYEMMAAGCVPVDVYRYNNLFDYEAGTGLLAYQSAASLAEAMLHLLENEDELAKRSSKSIATAAQRTLVWETDAAVNAVEHILEGGTFDDMPSPRSSYTDSPFIAEKDDKKPVQAWCAWQRKLANTLA